MALIFDQEDVVQLVGFRVGPKLFGANILTVSEILRDPAIDALGDMPPFIEGIVRLRGTVTPVVSLGMILGLPMLEPGQEKRWVLIAQAGKHRVGFIIDSVTPIIRIKADTILQPPDLIRSGVRSKYIRGVCETDKGLLMIVDLDRMLLDDEIKAMEQINAD